MTNAASPNAASHISVIAPPLAAAADASIADDLIRTPDFWPDISIKEFRDQARADDTFTAPRIRAAIWAALETVMADAQDWAVRQRDLGYERLDSIPADEIDGRSRLTRCFIRSVFAYAKAELTETYRDFDATGKGNRDEAWSDDTILQLRRDGKHALRDMIGRPRLYASSI